MSSSDAYWFLQPLVEVPTMYDDIRRRGAMAARDGKTLLDCPYFTADQMPHHTGEPIEKWHARVDAWESGWREATWERTARRPMPNHQSVRASSVDQVQPGSHCRLFAKPRAPT
ncbi:CrpP-related protein [Achromobacter mucicolens]|uniref:CrpP-related protein n=2 Tax=Achromobacter TaxID=222 RepID=UPI0039750A4F